jgi:maltose alpha-D-glucosyltransferase/alpha-amylase
MKFFDPANRKVLAYMRQYQDQRVLCVANLSRFAQPVDLDLSEAEGAIPVEMLGYVEFPPIERQPYRLTLAPYSFLWLELHQRTQPTEVSTDFVEQVPLNATAGWESLLSGASSQRLETINFVNYLPKQRWFGGKSRHIKSTRILDWTILRSSQSVLILLEVLFDTGRSDVYLLPLAMSFAEAAEELQRTSPNAVVAAVISGKGSGLLHDAVLDDNTCLELLSFIENGEQLEGRHGRIRATSGTSFRDILGTASTPLPVRRGSAEQSNTSILYGDRFILKLLRRQEPGLNPDAEIGQYLTDKVHFDRVPPFAGLIEYEPRADAAPSTMAMLQGLVANEGDGWKWTTEEVERYLEAVPRFRSRRACRRTGWRIRGPLRETRPPARPRSCRYLSRFGDDPRMPDGRVTPGFGGCDRRSSVRSGACDCSGAPGSADGPSGARLQCFGCAKRSCALLAGRCR